MIKKTRVRQYAGTSGYGLILVFDLDETIVNTTKPLKFNPEILKILTVASSIRGQGVDAIFLLTNNGDDKYVDEINKGLARITDYDNDKFFDAVMTANHMFRTLEDDYPIKHLQDIKILMSAARKPFRTNEDLMSRTYFFDDQEHVIQHEMEDNFDGKYANHYIKITPGFTGKEDDITDYTAINSAIRNIQRGGKRKNRRTMSRKIRRSS